MASLTTQERIEKTADRLAKLKKAKAIEDAKAANRVSGRAKQCAMITFNVLLKSRMDVLDWVQGELKRPQDVAAFAAWRDSFEKPAAAPANDPMLLASTGS